MSPPFTVGWVHNLEVAPATSDPSRVIGVAAAFSTIAVRVRRVAQRLGPPSTLERTLGGTDDGDSGERSRTSSPCDPQEQHITVVHEYTVEHADAR